MLGRLLWNDGWEFCKIEYGSEVKDVDGKEFKKVNIPHDWLIYQGQNLYEDSTGFYRKKFEVTKDSERRYEIYFEGVYMDSVVYVNGIEVGCWKYGYSSFFFDVTNELVDGMNTVMVKVNHKGPNSRWYSGAGIYRNVWFTEKPATHFVTDSMYIVVGEEEEKNVDDKAKSSLLYRLFHSKKTTGSDEDDATENKKCWNVCVSAELAGGLAQRASGLKNYLIKLDIPGAEISECFDAYTALYTETEEGYQLVKVNAVVENPKLWSIAEPNVYQARLTLIRKKEGTEWKSEEASIDSVSAQDSIEASFGFRTIRFDCDMGFFLNGENIKINGACEHHDLGALGAAFNKAAMRRKLIILKEMGINAIRTAHNMPAPELLELTDEMGFLVMDESFDMWESKKTEYDYARFFKEWQAKDVRSWIRRDRNHPSVIIWSIGNEIYDTHADAHGQEITAMLKQEVESHDPKGNAVISIGSNYMPWEGAQKCADILKYAGYNYAERLYDEHHAHYPDWYIFGSETSSTLQSRGIYHFPYSQPVMAEVDEQCSSLGNCTSTWGAKNSEYCITMDRDRAYSAGQFIWSGFDYIGEPTPYKNRNSYLGQIDTAGFMKDPAYLYKAAWTDYKINPFVHIVPEYWDFNEGQMIDVRVVSNAPAVQLFVNGKGLETVLLDQKHGDKFSADYIIPYEKGCIRAVAYDGDGIELVSEERHSFGEPVQLVAKLHYSESELRAGCSDMAFIEIGSIDADGNRVDNDNSPVYVEVSGAGWLAGLDNGDSTDTEEYKGHSKRLFVGRMLAMVAAGNEPGVITVSVSSLDKERGIKGTELSIKVIPAEVKKGVSLLPEILFNGKAVTAENGKPVNSLESGVWARKLELAIEKGNQKITAADDCVCVSAKVLPAGTKQKLEWYVVNDAGIISPYAEISEIKSNEFGETAVIRPRGDGEFRVRCLTRNSMRTAKLISELEFSIEGHGQATVNPYELVKGALCSRHQGELRNAIEQGIASAGGRCVITFDYLDFGDYGSDEITIPIFEMSSAPCPIEIWEGVPEEAGARKLYETIYQKPSIWNTYQADTYKLPERVKGLTTISLVFNTKMQLGGICFTKLEKAFGVLKGSDRDAVFGDSFKEEGTAIRKIGNNVTIEYNSMNFGDKGAGRITITGHTPNEVNTIHIVTGEGDDTQRAIIEFPHSESAITKTFEIERIYGEKKVRFIFLPGSDFDLEEFKFEE